ncbi:unnamed protein product [Miscanthus lutarioriparius]|uniref:Uncharacterized protein n=1 Tax=Miscanthus lutarioriparius TaxID=422564 RepID=A0A811S9A0_9POAL|nr:unnamed protein product [Miscanthus lutarioriparius]
MTRPPHGTPPRPAPATLSQAEAASATAAAVSEREEQCNKAKENLDVGTMVTVFGIAVLLGGLFLPKGAKHPGNAVRLTVSLLLSFATFLSGEALVLLSLNMMGRQVLVSGSHRVAAKCLIAACAVLSVLTLLSLLAFLPGGVYLYVGLSVVTAVTMSVAGAHWWLLRRRNGGGSEAAAVYDDDDDEDKGKEELDAASKTTCGLTSSAFGGLVGVLFRALSKISAGVAAAGSVESAAHAAIFFTFTTAILGVFVLTVSKVVTNQRRRCSRRRLLAIATAMRLANALLLCSLACAALSASFVVLRYRVFAAFAPLVFAAVLCFLLRHCVVVRHDRDGEEARIKAMEDIASKVTAATLGGIMTILGGALGEEDRDKWGSTSTGVVMVVLTSAFVSGFGFMVLAAAPGSATAILAPVARVLVWSTVALFTATAVAVYGVEVSGATQSEVKP